MLLNIKVNQKCMHSITLTLLIVSKGYFPKSKALIFVSIDFRLQLPGRSSAFSDL